MDSELVTERRLDGIITKKDETSIQYEEEQGLTLDCLGAETKEWCLRSTACQHYLNKFFLGTGFKAIGFKILVSPIWPN